MSSIYYPTLSSVAPLPVQPQGRESVPGQPQRRESVLGQPQRRESVLGQPQRRESVLGQPQRRKSVLGQPQRRESVLGQPQRRESVLGQPQRKESLLSHHDSRRKGSNSTSARGSQVGVPDHLNSESRTGAGGESSAKRKRTIFPPIPQARDNDDANVTSSSNDRRHSMAEVISRMRVREKTLLGEDLLKGRRHHSPVAGSKPSRADLSVPSITTEDEISALGWARTPWKQDTVGKAGARKASTWDAPGAWETPRGHHLSGPLGPDPRREFVVGFHMSTGQVEIEDRPCEDDSEGAGQSSPSLQDSAARGEGQSKDMEDDEEDFDFDEGEEEVTSQREQQQWSKATEAVYQRACHVLRVQPSPAFLRQCTLTVMDLRDVRLGPVDVKPIAIALVRDERVSSLDLSNNDLGPIGVSYIAEMLQENSTISDLNLSSTKPGREGVKALCETLHHNRTLTYLRLEENGIEHTESHLLADMIRCVPRLRGLYLGHNRLGYSGGAAIASAISQNSSMRTLDLQWNHIRRDSAVALVRALETNSHLRSLNLAWNGLGKEGCLALAHVLPKNGCLRELDLTCNRVDLMSLGFLLQGVTSNTSLACLRIGQNPLTTDGAKALIRAISSTPQLNISDIDIGGVPVDLEFTQMVSSAQKSRFLRVKHEEAITLATSDRKREHDGNNLDRFDPVMVLFEYMKLDNLRVIDMFQFMDTKKRDKLSKANIRDGLNTLKLPVTEHAIDIIFEKLDLNKDGFVELDEMMKVQRDTARQVKLRQIKAKAKNKEDGGLTGLHKALRDVITKRTEEKEPPRRDVSNSNNVISTTKTSGGGRKASVGGLQLTQARYSVTSSKRRGESDAQQLTTVMDEEEL